MTRVCCRKLSVDRFSIDCTKYLSDDAGMRSRASSGENLKRQRQPKLHHSRSDDNKRPSFDKHQHQKDSQSSRYSLNTRAVIESGEADEFKYFATKSLDAEENRGDYSDDSHAVDIDEPIAMPSEGLTEADALLEEPELENLPENCVENSMDRLNGNDEHLILEGRGTKGQSGETDDFFSDNFEGVAEGQETLYIADDEV